MRANYHAIEELRATAVYDGYSQVFTGTRTEIDTWLIEIFDPPTVSVTVLNGSGVLAGEKAVGLRKIRWKSFP